ALPSAPALFDAQLIGQTPVRNHPHRIITAQVSAPADHLLALHRHPSPIHPTLRSNPTRVPGQPFQPHGYPRSNALVPIHSSHPVQIVHHHIQVPVPVQVSQTHPVRHTPRVKAPRLTDILKNQITSIAKNHL